MHSLLQALFVDLGEGTSHQYLPIKIVEESCMRQLLLLNCTAHCPTCPSYVPSITDMMLRCGLEYSIDIRAISCEAQRTV